MKVRVVTKGVPGVGLLGAAAAEQHEVMFQTCDHPVIEIELDNGAMLRLADVSADSLSMAAQGADLLLLCSTQPHRVILARCGVVTQEGKSHWLIEPVGGPEEVR